MTTPEFTDPPLLRLGGEDDGFELDAAAVELRHDGERVALEPRPFRLLQYLVRHRDRVVPRQELLDEVWDGAFVADTAISTAIKHVRRAVGDRGSDSRWIEARRGLGYRFVAPVSVPPSIEWLAEPRGAQGDLHTEAMRRVQRGLEAMGDLAPGTTRDQLELELQITLARSLAKVRGWARETIEAWEYASMLCVRLGDRRREGITRFGLAAGLLTLGRIEEALERYSDVLKLGQDTGDRLLQVAGCIRGVPLMYLGRPRDAVVSLQAGIALSRDDDDFMGAGFSEDFAVTLRQWLAWALWLVGETEASRESGEAAIAIARRGDAFNLAYALMLTAAVALLRDDLAMADRLAEEARTLAAKEPFELVAALADMERATARGLRGDAREAGEAANDFVVSIGTMGKSGNRSGSGLILAFLASLQLRADRLQDAESTVRLALAMSPETGPFFDAELIRIRAELAMARGQSEQAAGDLDEALRIACAQGARGFELRIAATRARLAGAPAR